MVAEGRATVCALVLCLLWLVGASLRSRQSTTTKASLAFNYATTVTLDLPHAIHDAASSLRVYVYAIPERIAAQANFDRRSCYLSAGDQEHFRAEQHVPDWLAAHATVATRDPATADLFVVPHDLVCRRISAYQTNAVEEYMVPLLRWVREQPYFVRNNGSDHVLVYTMDNGVFCEQHFNTSVLAPLVRNMVIIGNNGVAGRPECFRVGHDIVIPPWHKLPLIDKAEAQALRPLDVFFKGQIIPGHHCSPGARQLIKQLLAGTNTLRTSARSSFGQSSDAPGHTRDAHFAFCPAGWACWSLRFFEAINMLTVPVVVADEIVLPFERLLDYRKFSVKVLMAHVLDNTTGSFALLDRVHAERASLERYVSHRSQEHHAELHELPYLMRKRHELLLIRDWFQWHRRGTVSAFSMLLLELWCRTPKSAGRSVCQQSSSTVAHAEFW